MINLRRHIPRRAVIRGAGAALALPFLDGMVPAFLPTRLSAAAPVKRLGCFYVPMGMEMAKWNPPAPGPLVVMPTLQPLEAFKDRLLVVGGLEMRNADSRDGGGPHSRIQAAWLTGTQARKTEGPDLRAGISMDQVAARELGAATQLPSLELALESVEVVGSCDNGYTCAYTGTLSWRTDTVPNPMENNPRAVFERLFGTADSTDERTRRAHLGKNASLLDSVVEETQRFSRGLNATDRTRLDQYLTSVRDVETRIHKAEQQISAELPVVNQPPGVPSSYEEHSRIMFDLLMLAYQSDTTRISTFLMARELSVRTYPEIGIADPHHPLSHHQNRPEQMEKQGKLNLFHMRLFSYFVEHMAKLPDGDGTLLDHSLLLYGTGMSDSNTHLPEDVPTVVIAGKLFDTGGGRYVRFPDGTPLTNLHLTLLAKMGVPTERLGDSRGPLNLLTGI
jgi:hypothetical protein